MYKILSRSLSRSEKSLANFTNIYRRVAKNQLFHHRSATSQTKNPLPKNHRDNREGNSSEIKEKHTLRVKSSPSLSTKKSFNFLRRSLVPETKETIHIMMFSTSSSKYFYASTLNQAKESATSKKKYFKNHKALDLYKQAVEQCMKIKFEKHRIQKGPSNVTWKPEPIRTSLLSDLTTPAKTKKKEVLPPQESTKKIVRLHPKKSISVEEMKQLVRQKKASQVVKKSKFRIVYPTHMIKYKLGLQKPYQVEKSMAKNQEPLVSKPKPETEKLEPVPKREINTVEVMPLKKRPNNNLEAVMKASRKRREKNDRSLIVEVDEAIKQLISKHPAMKKVTESAKMSINKKYNIILLKSQAKIRLQMKPREVTTDTPENLEMDRNPTDQNEVLTHSEQEVIMKSDIQKKLDADTSIVQHPIPTNLDQADLELVIKCPKRLLCEKSETFDIEEICLKTKESYIVYTEEVADAIKKMSQDKEEVKTVKEEVLERISANKEDYAPERAKSPNSQKLKEIMMKNAKQPTNQIDHQEPTIYQNSGNSAQNLINYIKKLNELKDQTSMERSTLQKPFSKTSMVQKVKMNKIKNSGVEKEIIKQEQGGKKATLTNKENVIDDQGNKKPMYEKLLEQSSLQKPVSQIPKNGGFKKDIIKQEQGEKKETLTNKENVIEDQSNKQPMYEKLLEQSRIQKPVSQKPKYIPTPNKVETEKEVRKTIMSRIKPMKLPQGANTVTKKCTSKYLLENYEPEPKTDDQSKEPLVQKTEAEVLRKKPHFQNIMNQYIVKPTSTIHEVEEDSESKSRTTEQDAHKPVGDIIEKISREERRLYNKNKLTSVSEDPNNKVEQKMSKPVEKISREDHNDKVGSISEGAMKEIEHKILEPVEETSREETTPYKDKLKNLLEPANQYLEKLREAGENQMKTLGALKDQFKNQLTGNIKKGLKKKNMLENMPVIQENVPEDNKQLPTKTFIVEDLDNKKLKVPTMEKDSFLLLVKEPTQEEEDFDVIQIELRKKSKNKDSTDSSSEPKSDGAENFESDKRNTLPNNRPTIRQDKPPQTPPTKNKNDKKEKPTGKGNIILPPSKPNERPRMSKNINRLDREEISMKKAEESRLSEYQGNPENSGRLGGKFDNLKQTNLAKCAEELENLENIVFKHKPRRRDALDADFIPEKFPNQQLFKNWLTILSDIEDLEIGYKDGSDSKLIQLAKEMDIIKQNLNTEKNPPLTSKQSQIEPHLDENFKTLDEDTVLEDTNGDQNMKMHPNWLHPDNYDAKKKQKFTQGNELINTGKLSQELEKSETQRPGPEQFFPMNVVEKVAKTEKVNLGMKKDVKMDSRPLKMMDYEYSSENMKVDENKSKIKHEAEIFHPKIIRKVKPEDVTLSSATKQEEDSKTKLSQKKVWTDSETIEITKSNIKNSVKVSNNSSLIYSGPKLSMKKEWKQKTEQKSTSNILKKSEQWKPTDTKKTDTDASRKGDKSENFVVILPHQNKTKVMEAVGIAKEKHTAKSETGLLRMYLLEENECYDEFISEIEKKKIPAPVKSISNDVELNKSSLKPVWNQNFKPTPVMDLSKKKLSTNLKSTENISGSNGKIKRPVEKPKFRRRSISDVTKSIAKENTEGKLMKMYLLDESESNEKLLKMQGKEKSKSSKDQGSSIRKNILRDNLKKIDTSKKSNEPTRETKPSKSLEELNKLNFPSYCFSDYLKAKKNRDNKIKSATNDSTSREKYIQKPISTVEVSPLESPHVLNKKNHTDLSNNSKSTEKSKLEKVSNPKEKEEPSQMKGIKMSDKETTHDIKSSKPAETENKSRKQVSSRESDSQILTRDNKLVCSNLTSNFVNKSPNSPTNSKTNTDPKKEENKKLLSGPKSEQTKEQPKIAIPKPVENSDKQLEANSIKKTSLPEKNHSDVDPKKSTTIVENPSRQKSLPILSKSISPEDLAEENKTKTTEGTKEKPEDKPTIPDQEKQKRYKKLFADFEKLERQKETQNQRPKSVLGTIVLRKIVEESGKPTAKLTMEKDLPKHPPQKKITTENNAVTKCCDKLCVPPKSISQVFHSQPRDDITTLTKSFSEKILSVPKTANKFDNYEKYKNLQISFITVRKPQKKNKSENFLPALLSMVEESKKKRENEKHLESNKAKMIAFRHEFLKKLKEEFDFLSENQNPSNFQKVCKHYEKVLKASTETNDNKSVLKLPMILEKQKEKDGENKVSLSNMSLNPDHVPKNSTELLIKKFTAKESNDEDNKAQKPEKSKTDPKKK